MNSGLEMKRENILIVKKKFQKEHPGYLYANNVREALIFASTKVYDRRKKDGAQSVMIEDTNCVQDGEKSWVIQVDYYEVF